MSQPVSGKFRLSVAATAVSALMLAAAPAWSQTPSTGMAKADTTDTSKVAKGDSKLMGDLAQGNIAEVAAGKLALDKSPNEATKKFAQQMIDDHTAALGEVQKLAESKGVTLPTEPSLGQKTEATALKALSGNTFDKQYRSHAGVGDHERTVKLLKKIQADAKDADFKALATKMLPTVEHHLMMAKELNAQKS
jgi:putative membrane protein